MSRISFGRALQSANPFKVHDHTSQANGGTSVGSSTQPVTLNAGLTEIHNRINFQEELSFDSNVSEGIGANKNNWSSSLFSTNTWISIAVSGGPYNVTGFDASLFVTGQMFMAFVSGGDIVLKHNVTSTLGNRIYCPNLTDITQQDGSGFIIRYSPDVDANKPFLVIASSAVSPAGAPTTVDYLVGTASGSLSAEIVVGTTPGGELGGTWGSPTVDATHSGSTHHAQSHTHSAAGGSGSAITPVDIAYTGSLAGSAIYDIGSVSSAQDNVNIGDVAIVKMTASGANRALTGMVKYVDYQRVTIINSGSSNNVNLNHDNAGSSAANRFYCAGAATYALTPYDSVDVIYDAAVSRWRVLGH